MWARGNIGCRLEPSLALRHTPAAHLLRLGRCRLLLRGGGLLSGGFGLNLGKLSFVLGGLWARERCDREKVERFCTDVGTREFCRATNTNHCHCQSPRAIVP